MNSDPKAIPINLPGQPTPAAGAGDAKSSRDFGGCRAPQWKIIWCAVCFLRPAYARGCASQPPRTHVRAETSNSSSEPVCSGPEIARKIGTKGKADVWAHAKLGWRCNVLPWVHLCFLMSNPEASRVAAWCWKGVSTSDTNGGISARLEMQP